MCIRDSFKAEEIQSFPMECYDSGNKRYYNGFVGMNNISPDGYSVAVLQAIAHISSVRDYFLIRRSIELTSHHFLDNVSLLLRKLWSPKLLRRNISPQELMHSILIESKKRFTADAASDPRSFLLWFISYLFAATKEEPLKKLLVNQLQGKISISFTKVDSILDTEGKVLRFSKDSSNSDIRSSNFWMLTLELPPMPFFNNANNNDTLPQTSLGTLLKQFDGVTEHHNKEFVKTFKITKYPRYLILHFNRFDKGFQSIKDRNQTIVEFQLEMDFYGNKYRLISNIIHEAYSKGKVFDTEDLLASKWKTQIRNDLNDQWYEFDDIEVKKTDKEFLFLQECYLQVWEKI